MIKDENQPISTLSIADLRCLIREIVFDIVRRHTNPGLAHQMDIYQQFLSQGGQGRIND